MKNIILLSLLLFLNFFSVFGQLDSNYTRCCRSNEKGKQGFWKLPTGFNYVYNGIIIRGGEAEVLGYFKDDKRVGLWEIKNYNGKLLGYRIFEDDESYVEVQLRKKKVVSIIIYKSVQKNNILDHYFVTDVVSFNKRGRFIKRTTFLE